MEPVGISSNKLNPVNIFGPRMKRRVFQSVFHFQKECPDNVHVTESTEGLDDKERKKRSVKLHFQFGHGSAEILRQLLKSAHINSPNIFHLLQEVVKDCESCNKHKKPPARLAVGLPRASDFNDVVAVDLHKLDNNFYYLHIIDKFSQFSAGCIVDNERPKTIVGSFIKQKPSFVVS
ncbi:hypothetical protein HOLleu_42233 [Holothuria leucospilota]|uniref:Uncharacterized protein n=1 Tax=Holothuria leucospilota TaxID=206669 RepID=A0A9Q0YFN1_HOLLE|nr:hypothetical protein HOLleu_42233 [Holothuria leucospilota]